MRKTIFQAVIISFIFSISFVFASTWTGNNASNPNSWHIASNWDNGIVPNATEPAWFTTPNRPSPLITAYATASYMVVGNTYDLGTCVPRVDAGGHLQMSNTPIYVGYNNGKGKFVLNGGQISGVNWLIVGGDLGTLSDGLFEIWSGTCQLNEGLAVGWTGKGAFGMGSGTLNTNNLFAGYAAGSNGAIWIGGGTVNATNMNTNCANDAASTGQITIVGGTVNVSNMCYIGWGTNAGVGYFTMTGGTLDLGANSLFAVGLGSGTTGWMNVTGGQIIYRNPNQEFRIGSGGSGTLTVNGPCYIETFGRLRVGNLVVAPSRLDLKSGRIHVRGDIAVKNGSIINIEEGVLTLKDDQRALIMGLIIDGKLVGYNGAGGIMLDYDKTYPNKTCVRAALPSAGWPAPMDFYIFNTREGTDSQDITMASLAGLVNRTNPEMLVCGNFWTTKNYPEYWLTELAAYCPIRIAYFGSDPNYFINRYKSLIKGYVRYEGTSSKNQAVSYAGILDSIIVDSETLSLATGNGLPQKADVRSISQETAYSTYQSSYNKNAVFCVDPALSDRKHSMLDLSISKKSYSCYMPSNFSTILANQNDNTLVLGFGPERTLFGQSSLNNLMVIVGSYLMSHSAFEKWTVDPAPQRGHTHPSKPTESDVHYVAFVLSDGDNLPFVLGTWLASTSFYSSPHRGTFSMNWDMTPEIANLNCVAMNHIYWTGSRGTNKDFFVTAGGKGICFPSQYPDKDGYVLATVAAMKKADHNVISILDESFSSTVMNKLAAKREVLGIMYKTYDDYYKGRDGQITWHNGKPCVSVKYSLWDGCHSKEYIASQLNVRPRAPKTNQDSYTIVNVHPWSRNMDDVKWIVNNLNSKVRVVTLEELMIHLRNNFGTPVSYPTLLKIAQWWLSTGCNSSNGWCDESDLDGDGKVNFKDFEIYAEKWHMMQ